LTLAPGKGFGEGGLVGFAEKLEESLAVGVDGVDGFLPGAGVGWGGGFGPVVVGPLFLFVVALGVVAEVEHVLLGYAEVLDDLPGGVGQALGDFAMQGGGKVFYGVFEGGVGVTAFEEGDKFGLDVVRRWRRTNTGVSPLPLRLRSGFGRNDRIVLRWRRANTGVLHCVQDDESWCGSRRKQKQRRGHRIAGGTPIF